MKNQIIDVKIGKIKGIIFSDIHNGVPIQATGIIGKHAFYFRAICDYWEFMVSTDASIYPQQVDCRDEHYFKCELLGKDADTMDYKEVNSLIVHCAEMFDDWLSIKEMEAF